MVVTVGVAVVLPNVNRSSFPLQATSISTGSKFNCGNNVWNLFCKSDIVRTVNRACR